MNGLNALSGWSEIRSFFAPRSAQGYLNSNQLLFATSGVGSACGSGDPAPQPSACGAGDEPKPQPSACGAGDDSKPKSACGSACGAAGK